MEYKSYGGMDFDFVFQSIPSRFFTKKHYDHILNANLGNQGTTTIIDFPNIDENSIITKWGCSITTDFPAPRELVYSLYDNVLISLKIGGAGVPGYSGINFSPNGNAEPFVIAGNDIIHPFSLGNAQWLVDLCYPIAQGQTKISVEVTNTGMTGTYIIWARVIGIYNSAV